MSMLEELKKEFEKHLRTVGLINIDEKFYGCPDEEFCDCPDEKFCEKKREALLRAIKVLEK